jgi:TetR/AcrR family tetracycline transcriptional repressor
MMAERGQEGRRRPPGAAGGLSRNQVLDTALQIVETEGIERLTIRGLAGKLGVAPTAIYWHVGGKQALLDGVAGRVIDQLAGVTVRGRDPVARIVSIASSLRTTLLERADLVALVHRQGRTAALFQPARRLLVNEFTVAGVNGAAAALAVQAVLNLVIGSVLLDRQLERQPAQQETLDQLWLLGLPDSPDLPELLKHFSDPVDEKQLFDYTLAVVVGAIVPSS